MQNNIHIITSAPIKYEFDGHGIYDSFDLVSRGVLNAPLVEGTEQSIKDFPFPFDILQTKYIFTATHGQTFETGKLLQKVRCPDAELMPTEFLNNIKFSLKDLISKTEFFALPRETALAKMRAGFFAKHKEPIIVQSRNLINLLKDYPQNALCIGHSFYMKILENELCHAEFATDSRPYEPLRGFDFEIST